MSRVQVPSLALMKRNPWRGLNPLKEFWWDITHPRDYWKGEMAAGLRGENPRVAKENAKIFFYGVCGVGILNFLIGIAMVTRGYLS